MERADNRLLKIPRRIENRFAGAYLCENLVGNPIHFCDQQSIWTPTPLFGTLPPSNLCPAGMDTIGRLSVHVALSFR